jgi:hypothetical protein
MPQTSRRLLLASLCALLAGCAGPPRVEVAPSEPPFTLERFFAGRTVGTGGFTAPIAGINRPFKVTTQGTWDGRVLTLVEDFAYADGERDRKTWRFTKLAPGLYEGTREDVIGKASVRQVGQRVELLYSADIPNKDGSTIRLDFADTLAPAGPGRVINRATVSRFGVPFGTVDLSFVKR